MSLYDYRELIKNLVVSDLKVKYANSMLGFAWSLLNPLLMMLVLYFVFSNFFGSGGSFVLYILTGLLVWRFFSIGTSAALASVVGKPSLVTKIYIPREILPLSSTLSSLISSVLEFCVLVPLLFIFGIGLSPAILLFPVLLAMFFLIVYGMALILSSLFVYFRDLNNIWDVLMQVGFFACPIMYPLSQLSKLPEQIKTLYMLNPVTLLIEMYRDIFLEGTVPDLWSFAIVLVFGVVLVVFGNAVFKRLQRRFAEEV
ncbi:ABC transporter permease protein [Methanocella paludicola SANAE]|uniref:ABC transporter permease protein n=1 Tax=Methanocella paludicola (strain DSM 17711 / JCM 13418 / NBRC 101707 / SANAE) TaxID=304371 RepID=D1YV46_METPS|nr:ABC transporter permease [Methanocella paludicola]BAI60318.1 ABC transporter permease protein [Methanocella paludicola SANAE]